MLRYERELRKGSILLSRQVGGSAIIFLSPSNVVVGNSNMEAGTTSPARVEEAVTVGAVDSQNVKACFSNYGPELDGESPLLFLVRYTNAGPVWDLGVNVLSAVSLVVGGVSRTMAD